MNDPRRLTILCLAAIENLGDRCATVAEVVGILEAAAHFARQTLEGPHAERKVADVKLAIASELVQNSRERAAEERGLS